MSKETLSFVTPPPAEKLQNFFGVFLQFQIGVDNKFRTGNGGWSIPYTTAKGQQKYRTFAEYMDCKDNDKFNDVIVEYAIRHAGTMTTLEKRLAAGVCELCGKTNTSLAMHHVNKVKNLKGKQQWEIVMIAKRRKTLAVCKDCHYKIHHP